MAFVKLPPIESATVPKSDDQKACGAWEILDRPRIGFVRLTPIRKKQRDRKFHPTLACTSPVGREKAKNNGSASNVHSQSGP